MIHAKNYKTASKFVKIMQRKRVASFFPHTVYTITVIPSVRKKQALQIIK